MTQPKAPVSLVADIGGTNTRVALATGALLRPDTVARYKNAEFGDLAEVLDAYLGDHGTPDCDAACVALAGPVRDHRGTMTNLDWSIDPATVATATRAERVAVLNDLQAQGHALGYVTPDHLTCLKPGAEAEAGAARLMIGIGTGFNIAPVLTENGQRIVAPAEAGHITLPTRTAQDRALADHLEAAHGFPSVEEALSGRGVAQVAAWHAQTTGQTPNWTPAEVVAAATSGDPVAKAALEQLTRLLATVIGDLSLIHLPFGGVFLVGGVARALSPWIKSDVFVRAMQDKGRFSSLVSDIPVWLVEDDYAALTGQAHYLDQLR